MVQTGAKTLMSTLQDIPKVDSKNIDTELDPILRTMWDILEELNRRIWDLGSLAVSTETYLATYSSNAAGETTGWYNCTLVKYQIDGTTEAVPDGLVLNLIEQFHGDEITDELSTAQKYICWRITDDDSATHRYVGVELFGRGSIGRC